MLFSHSPKGQIGALKADAAKILGQVEDLQDRIAKVTVRQGNHLARGVRSQARDSLDAMQSGLKRADVSIRGTVSERPYHVALGTLVCGILLGAIVPLLFRERT